MNFPVPIPSGGGSPFPFPKPNIPSPRPPSPPGKVPGIKGSSLSWLTPAAACALLGTNCALPFSSPYEGEAAAIANYTIEFKYKRRLDRVRVLRDGNNNSFPAEGGGVLVEWAYPGIELSEVTLNWSYPNCQILSIEKKLFHLKTTRYEEGYEITLAFNGKQRTFKLVLAADVVDPIHGAIVLQESRYQIKRDDGEPIEPWGGSSFNPIGDFIIPTPKPGGLQSPSPPSVGFPVAPFIPEPVVNVPGGHHTGNTNPDPVIGPNPPPFPLPIPQPPPAPPEGNRDDPLLSPNPPGFPLPTPEGIKPPKPLPNPRDLIPTILQPRFRTSKCSIKKYIVLKSPKIIPGQEYFSFH